MKSQTALVVQQTRLSEWDEQNKRCQNRPQGMKIDEWKAKIRRKKGDKMYIVSKNKKSIINLDQAICIYVETDGYTIKTNFKNGEKLRLAIPLSVR